MKQYLIKQVFSIVVAIVLLITFYIVLMADLATPGETFMTPLILIIIIVRYTNRRGILHKRSDNNPGIKYRNK